MAEKLLQYYKYISDFEGFGGKIKLAQLTKVPSVKAAMEPDSPDNLRIFREAIKKMRIE